MNLPRNAWVPGTSTAICGNDITSSCLYVSAIATVYAHALSPVALLIVAGILFLYRKIYTEVVEALPLNGGAYNCLLNSTRKFTAALAACLTLLSYLATAVISAKTAAEYLDNLLPFLPAMETTAVVLVIFAALTILGITESARVALVIFTIHLTSLTFFVLLSLPKFIMSSQIWTQNWHQLVTEVNWPKALFLGVSAAMLGVSGFESSSNFVEQQEHGVFRLTLRNMWLAVTVFNPVDCTSGPGIDAGGGDHPLSGRPLVSGGVPGGGPTFLPTLSSWTLSWCSPAPC